MAHIEYSPISHSTMLYLSREDLQVLKPCIEAALKKALMMQDKYQDIHDSGYATDLQEDKLINAEETVYRLKDILDKAKSLLD
jgi:hypothetical protein